MLQAWINFFHTVDADIITGFNILNFDLRYIIDRSRRLKNLSLSQFSRIKQEIPTIIQSTLVSLVGSYASKTINTEGRLQFDMMRLPLLEHKLEKWSLAAVAKKFLGDYKEDV